MPRINLLPWRDWERKRRQQRFIAFLALSFILGIGVTYWISSAVDGRIDAQNQRNHYLQSQIQAMNKRIAAIKSLRRTRHALLARMRVIEKLEQSRPLVVHLFDQLVRTVPGSVYLKSVVNSHRNLVIKGIAESPAAVSVYMRNIGNSTWLAPPTLQVVRTVHVDGHKRSRFTVTTKLSHSGSAAGTNNSKESGS